MQDGSDIDNYEIAKERLEDKMKEYKAARGNGGKIPEIEEKIMNLKRQLENCNLQEENMSILKEKIRTKEDENLLLSNKIETLQKEYENLSKIETSIAKKNHYNSLLKNIENKQKRIATLNEFFRNYIPEDEKLNDIAQAISKNNEAIKEINANNLTADEENSLSNLEKLFKDHEVSEEDLEECQKNINDINNIDDKIKLYKISDDEMQKYEKLKTIFSDSINLESKIEENIKSYEKQKEIESKVNEYESEKEMIMNEQEKTKQMNMGKCKKMFILSGIILVISITICLLNTKIALIGVMIGVLISIYSFYEKIKTAKKTKGNQYIKELNEIDVKIKELNLNKEAIDKDITGFLNKYVIQTQSNILMDLMNIKEDYNNYMRIDNMIRFNKNSILDLDSKKQEKIEKVNSILSHFYNYFGKNYEETLTQVKLKQKEYIFLKNRFNHLKENSEKNEKLERTLEEFFNRYYNNITLSYEELLDEIKNNKNEYNILLKDFNKAKEEKNEFEKENNIQEIVDYENKEEKYTIEEIKEQIEYLNKEKEENIKNITNIKASLTNIIDIVDEKSDIEAEIENLNEMLEGYKQKYKILNKTKELLEKAKDKLTTKYLTNIRTGFIKYARMLKGTLLENSNIDVNLKVKLEENGEQRVSDYLSLGYKDLIGICLRFAIIDSVFTNETAFIILDDPFVNLDEEKLTEAIKLVEEISKEYQVIYFICHKSRQK